MAHERAANSRRFALATLLIAAGFTHAEAPAAGAAPAGGIWKAAVPPKSMKGEFDSFDPLGVAAGARIKADCSLNWIDPDDGKLYCFSSGSSLEFFLDAPRANLERARTGWRKMNSRGIDSPAHSPHKIGDAP